MQALLQTGPCRPRVPCPCPWPPLLQSPSKEPWLGCVVTAGGRRPASLHPYSLCWVLAPPWGGRCPQGGGREPLACTLPARSSSFLRGLFPEPGGGDSPGGVAGLGVPAGQAPWDGVRRHSPSCGGSWRSAGGAGRAGGQAPSAGAGAVGRPALLQRPPLGPPSSAHSEVLGVQPWQGRPSLAHTPRYARTQTGTCVNMCDPGWPAPVAVLSGVQELLAGLTPAPLPRSRSQGQGAQTLGC